MTFNTDFAERVLAQIKDHPETWQQGAYRCGTGMCFAGWAVTLAGVEWRDLSLNDELTAEGIFAPKAAARLLGITYDYEGRSAELFHPANNLDRIERLVKHFANNPDDDSLPEDES